MTMSPTKFIQAILNPTYGITRAWRKIGLGSFELRLMFDAVERPHYAYGLFHAARLARILGHQSIAAVEFGVAGGNGLLAMCRLADAVQRVTGVHIEVFGFDTGVGLPKSLDHRDLPYLWPEGSYSMDADALRRRLPKNCHLVLGNVRETVSDFIAKHKPPVIGFAAFDLDFYSSTRDAFLLFDGPATAFLPRTLCYMDDIVGGTDFALHCEYVGELAAIKEYNARSETRKIAPIHGLELRRPLRSRWALQMYAHHDFAHPQYGQYVFPGEKRELALNA